MQKFTIALDVGSLTLITCSEMAVEIRSVLNNAINSMGMPRVRPLLGRAPQVQPAL